jgi:hypothetical protein
LTNPFPCCVLLSLSAISFSPLSLFAFLANTNSQRVSAHFQALQLRYFVSKQIAFGWPKLRASSRMQHSTSGTHDDSIPIFLHTKCTTPRPGDTTDAEHRRTFSKHTSCSLWTLTVSALSEISARSCA